jgi:hypothetical protein
MLCCIYLSEFIRKRAEEDEKEEEEEDVGGRGNSGKEYKTTALSGGELSVFFSRENLVFQQQYLVLVPQLIYSSVKIKNLVLTIRSTQLTTPASRWSLIPLTRSVYPFRLQRNENDLK